MVIIKQKINFFAGKNKKFTKNKLPPKGDSEKFCRGKIKYKM